jgi:DNA-binding FrmR family transcriptional regulator
MALKLPRSLPPQRRIGGGLSTEDTIVLSKDYHTGVGYKDESQMGHTVTEKTKLLARVRRIRGQVEGLERALEAERGCNEILQQIVAARGAMNALMTEVIEEHVRGHIASPSISSNAERTKGANELVEALRMYLK